MSKTARRVKGYRKIIHKVIHPPFLRTYIPAGKALAGPPLGPMLGQRNINVAKFCKEFNEKTQDVKEGVPIPCNITVKPDRSFEIAMDKPPLSYFLKQAAGCEKGSMTPGPTDWAGKITLKHVYEIAKIKSEDPLFDCVPLKEVCQIVIDASRTCGVEVVPKLTVEEYAEFLEMRKEIVAAQAAEWEEKRKAKILRQAKVV